MKYYFIGNDGTPNNDLFHKGWIKKNYAYTSGDEKYGNCLKKLKEGDLLFCYIGKSYVGKTGLVAVGKVIAEWDGIGHEDPIYKDRPDEQGRVYKIEVKWHKDLTNSPIPYEKLKKCGPFSVRQTLQEIKNKKTAAKILALVESYNDHPWCHGRMT